MIILALTSGDISPISLGKTYLLVHSMRDDWLVYPLRLNRVTSRKKKVFSPEKKASKDSILSLLLNLHLRNRNAEIDTYTYKQTYAHTHTHISCMCPREKKINLRAILSLTFKQIYYNRVMYVVLSNFTSIFCMCAIMVVNIK